MTSRSYGLAPGIGKGLPYGSPSRSNRTCPIKASGLPMTFDSGGFVRGFPSLPQGSDGRSPLAGVGIGPERLITRRQGSRVTSVKVESLPSTKLFVFASRVLCPLRTPSRQSMLSTSALYRDFAHQRATEEGLSCSAVGFMDIPSPLPRGNPAGDLPGVGFRRAPAPQSVAFAVTWAARLPQPFRADNLTGPRRGFTCVTGCTLAPSSWEASVTPLGTRDFSPALGSATRRRLGLPWRDLHPQVDDSLAGRAMILIIRYARLR